MTREEMYERKKEFVYDLLDPCLHAAKPNLNCMYYLGSEIELTSWEKKMVHIVPQEEYVVVTTDSNHRYFINVSGDSLCCIAEEVFRAMSCK